MVTKLVLFGEVNLLAVIHEWLSSWLQGLGVAIVDVATQDAEVTDVALQTEQFSELRRYNNVTTSRLCELIS